VAAIALCRAQSVTLSVPLLQGDIRIGLMKHISECACLAVMAHGCSLDQSALVLIGPIVLAILVGPARRDPEIWASRPRNLGGGALPATPSSCNSLKPLNPFIAFAMTARRFGFGVRCHFFLSPRRVFVSLAGRCTVPFLTSIRYARLLLCASKGSMYFEDCAPAEPSAELCRCGAFPSPGLTLPR
jgi:hypothetical protein